MATSRRDSRPNARTNNNRAVRNMSPVQKPVESDDQVLLRRARSVPSSPDRRSSASFTTAAAASSLAVNAGRPSSSVNPRSASSSSSSAHGKPSVSAVAGAKQAATVMRRRADKATAAGGATSVWPHALTTPNSKLDSSASKAAAKSPSSTNMQKSKLSSSTRPGGAAERASPKPRTQKATTAGAGKAQAASSSARNPSAKRRTGLETSAPSSPIQMTASVPAVAAAPRAEEHDVELLMEGFDELESISTPSIEEHLQQRLPDPVDVGVTAQATSEEGPPTPSEPSSCRGGVITVFSEEKRDHLNGGGNADVGLDSGAAVAKEAVGETELKEAVNGAELNEETAAEIELKDANNTEPEPKEDPEELEVKDEESEANKVQPAATKKTPEAVPRWMRKDDGRSNEAVKEEDEGGRSKPTTTMQERRNKVMALVGKFETAMSARD